MTFKKTPTNGVGGTRQRVTRAPEGKTFALGRSRSVPYNAFIRVGLGAVAVCREKPDQYPPKRKKLTHKRFPHAAAAPACLTWQQQFSHLGQRKTRGMYFRIIADEEGGKGWNDTVTVDKQLKKGA